MHAGLGRLHRIELVMDGRCRTGEILDFIDLDIEREAHVVAHQFETRMSKQGMHIVPRPGVEVVDAKDFVAVRQQAIA